METETSRLEKIKLTVQLTLAKLEIVKLKHANQGYDWAMCDKKGQEQLDKTLIEIDKILKETKY